MQDFNIAIKEYNGICDRIVDIFAKKYFGSITVNMWVASETGGVIIMGDYFFNMTDMIDYMKYKYSKKEMFEHADYVVECAIKNESPTNIKNYKKLK